MSPYRGEWDVLEGIDAARRVGWAKFFEADEKRETAEVLAQVLLEVLYDLADAVLHGHVFEAFAIAYKIRHGNDGGQQ